MLSFEQPLLLLLLIPISIMVILTWRRMSLPFSRSQRYMILASRLVLFTLIATALAGATLSVPISRKAVVFVGDISASTTPQRAFIEQWINNAIRHKGSDDQVGIVAVGRNALVEQSVRTQLNFSQFESIPDTNYTDLAAGLRLAAAILPLDSERRIVLLSDGQQNQEDALQEAQILQQEGIRLDVVPLPTSNGPEARIDGLTAPSILQTNERFILHARIFSSVAQHVTLHLYLDQALLLQQSLQLTGGEQEITFTLNAPPRGFHTYRITMDAPQDTISQNNEAAVFVNVQGPAHILVIEGRPGAGHNIINALQATRIDVSIGVPVDVPTTLDGLVNYDAVVLADVPAIDLGSSRMQVLQTYVRDLGRGLVVSGGENSYGVGGYANTPLEETLPVSMEIPQHKDTPTIAVVLIIESLENTSGVNISKEAAKGVINLVTPRDYIGVSDAYGKLAIPIEHVTNKAAIDQTIDKMNPNDPQTSYLQDLEAAETALLHNDAKIKHVILIGDGDAHDNYATQVLKMVSEHISVSVVGTNIGSYEDLTMMQQIAAWGKGRFYQADNPNAIPQILLNETKQASRRAFIEEPFVPAIITPHPILTGLGTLPQLTGYVATTPKSTAQIVLTSHLDDPVLAVWQYGLGRVVAWTSDALGLWTANWQQWADAARWWANLVTWTVSTPNNQLIVNSEIVAGNGHITVDIAPQAIAASGQQNQQVLVKIIAPDLAQQNIALQPTAPERWEGTFPTTQVGAYLLRVSWHAKSNAHTSSPNQLTTTTGLVIPYSPEFSSSGTDTHFLNLLAHAGGGSILGTDNTASPFFQNLPPVYASLSIIFWLFAIAALLLPIDIALRRLSSLEFLVIGCHWLLTHLGLHKAALTTTSDNLVLNTIRSNRTERKIRSSRHRSKIPTTATKPVTGKAQAKKSATQDLKKLQEVSMTAKLLEAKRRRSSTHVSEE